MTGPTINSSSGAAAGPRFISETDAMEWASSIIETHFPAKGLQDTKQKKVKVEVLQNMNDLQLRCLQKIVLRRGLRICNICSYNSTSWTSVIGYNEFAVYAKDQELRDKAYRYMENRNLGSADERARRRDVADTWENSERRRAAVRAAEDRVVFVEEQRQQRELRKVDVEEQHNAFLKRISQTERLNGMAGEWKVHSEAIAEEFPEFSGRFDFSLSFAEVDEELFGSFVLGVVEGIIRMEQADFGSGNSVFDWRGRDTQGNVHEGKGHLSLLSNNFTKMEGVLMATSLYSSDSCIIEYAFEALRVSSNPISVGLASWSDLRKRGSRFRTDNESEDVPEHNESDSEEESRDSSEERIDQYFKNRDELQYDVDTLKEEIRQMVEEKASTTRVMESRLLKLYCKHGKAFYDYRLQHEIVCEEQAAQIASLKLALSRLRFDQLARWKKRKSSRLSV